MGFQQYIIGGYMDDCSENLNAANFKWLEANEINNKLAEQILQLQGQNQNLHLENEALKKQLVK